jgi:hypothetical protein
MTGRAKTERSRSPACLHAAGSSIARGRVVNKALGEGRSGRLDIFGLQQTTGVEVYVLRAANAPKDDLAVTKTMAQTCALI